MMLKNEFIIEFLHYIIILLRLLNISPRHIDFSIRNIMVFLLNNNAIFLFGWQNVKFLIKCLFKLLVEILILKFYIKFQVENFKFSATNNKKNC